MAMKSTFGFADNDETRAEQSETASTAKRVLLRRSERSEAMRNEECRSRLRSMVRSGFWTLI
jgi:hypothetical protein